MKEGYEILVLNTNLNKWPDGSQHRSEATLIPVRASVYFLLFTIFTRFSIIEYRALNTTDLRDPNQILWYFTCGQLLGLSVNRSNNNKK